MKKSKADLKVGLYEDWQTPSRAFVEADLRVGLACTAFLPAEAGSHRSAIRICRLFKWRQRGAGGFRLRAEERRAGNRVPFVPVAGYAALLGPANQDITASRSLNAAVSAPVMALVTPMRLDCRLGCVATRKNPRAAVDAIRIRRT